MNEEVTSEEMTSKQESKSSLSYTDIQKMIKENPEIESEIERMQTLMNPEVHHQSSDQMLNFAYLFFGICIVLPILIFLAYKHLFLTTETRAVQLKVMDKETRTSHDREHSYSSTSTYHMIFANHKSVRVPRSVYEEKKVGDTVDVIEYQRLNSSGEVKYLEYKYDRLSDD